MLNIHGIILTDNTFIEQVEWTSRGNGAHRIATWLRQNSYNIEVVDFCLRWTLEEWNLLLDRLVGEQTIFLGVGVSLFYDEKNILNNLLKECKRRFPHIKIIVGGGNLLSRIDNFEFADYLIEGYAEVAQLVLLEFLQGKRDIKTIKFHEKSKAIPLIDAVRDYPVHNTNDLSVNYLESDFIRENEALVLETGRGCIFKCKFCTYQLIGKKKIDYLRDPSTIYNELLNNYKLWGTTKYTIGEDTFNDSVEKLEMIADLVKKLPFKLEICGYLRLDLIMAKPESIKLLKTIGLKGVHFGIETFTPAAGKIIGKPAIKLKQGLPWFKKLMPETNVYATMIVGLPEDDPKKFYEYRDFLAASGIEGWGFNPLYLSNPENTIWMNEFGKNYKEYGFEPMTEDEIRVETLKDDPKQTLSEFTHYLKKSFLNKSIPWKNIKNGTNYFEMSRLANDLRNTSTTRGMSSWAMFTYIGLGYSIEEIIKWKYHQEPFYPKQEIERRAVNFVKYYKQKKINFDYNKQYN
jgi:radical SAM superfamily enzyme YgiQ (UPF0313 family)